MVGLLYGLFADCLDDLDSGTCARVTQFRGKFARDASFYSILRPRGQVITQLPERAVNYSPQLSERAVKKRAYYLNEESRKEGAASQWLMASGPP